MADFADRAGIAVLRHLVTHLMVRDSVTAADPGKRGTEWVEIMGKMHAANSAIAHGPTAPDGSTFDDQHVALLVTKELESLVGEFSAALQAAIAK
jgi:hypothetical protein